MSLTDQLAHYEMEADAIKKVFRCSHCITSPTNAYHYLLKAFYCSAGVVRCSQVPVLL